jgi:hypothetical protein
VETSYINKELDVSKNLIEMLMVDEFEKADVNTFEQRLNMPPNKLVKIEFFITVDRQGILP